MMTLVQSNFTPLKKISDDPDIVGFFTYFTSSSTIIFLYWTNGKKTYHHAKISHQITQVNLSEISKIRLHVNILPTANKELYIYILFQFFVSFFQIFRIYAKLSNLNLSLFKNLIANSEFIKQARVSLV